MTKKRIFLLLACLLLLTPLAGCSKAQYVDYKDAVAGQAFAQGLLVARENGQVELIKEKKTTPIGTLEAAKALLVDEAGGRYAASSNKKLLITQGTGSHTIDLPQDYSETSLHFGPDGTLYLAGQYLDKANATEIHFPQLYDLVAYSTNNGSELWRKTFAAPVKLLAKSEETIWLAHQKDTLNRDIKITVQNGGQDYLGRNFDWSNEIIELNRHGQVLTSFEALGCVPVFAGIVGDEILIGFGATGNGLGSIRRYDRQSTRYIDEISFTDYIFGGGMLADGSIIVASWDRQQAQPGSDAIDWGFVLNRLVPKDGGREYETTSASQQRFQTTLRPEVPPIYNAFWINETGESYAVMHSAGVRTTLDQTLRVFSLSGEQLALHQIPDDQLAGHSLQVSLGKQGEAWVNRRYYLPR